MFGCTGSRSRPAGRRRISQAFGAGGSPYFAMSPRTRSGSRTHVFCMKATTFIIELFASRRQ